MLRSLLVGSAAPPVHCPAALGSPPLKHLAQSAVMNESVKTGAIFKVLFTSEETKHGRGGGAVILEPPKIKSDTVSTVSPSISHEVVGAWRTH